MGIPFDRLITIEGSGASPSAHQYVHDISALLHDVFRSDTGRAVRREITRSLTIRPNPGGPANARPDNQTAATRQGRMVRNCRTGFGLQGADGELLYGAGIGTDVTIEFTPSDHGAPSPTNFLSADSVLVHEMTHAVRMMAGVLDCDYMRDDFDTIEEFFATLVGNIFRSERGRTALCPSHNPSGPMAHESDYMRGRGRVGLVDRMARQQPRFTRALSQVQGATFNPFLDYY